MDTRLRRTRAGVFGAAALLLLGVGYGFGVMRTSQASQVSADPPHAQFAVDHSPNVTLQLPNFSSIVQKYGPAVVNVKVKSMVRSYGFGQMPGLNPNDPFYYFFRQFQQSQPKERPVEGVGSGFIIRPDGIILTNAHVVAGAQTVIVTLTDKRQFNAKVIGIDKPTDIAVLKISANHLPTVKIGDPSTVKVGQWAVAIGSPYDFVNSVTAGIISAKARSLPGEGLESSYVPFIQTDVPVNPGNSGGPLFELNGDVIGINSQIYTGTGSFDGISFAIPINIAMHTAEQLLAHGKVERGRLGIEIQPVTQSLAQAFGLKRPEGALVASVSPDSPAERAGLMSGDVILKFNGHAIAEETQLPLLVADTAPGSKATITVWRTHKEHTLDITVGGSPGKHAKVASNGSAGSNQGLGLMLKPLTPSERAQAHVRGGLVVEAASGPAAAAGIQPGDIVLALNGQPVNSIDQLRSDLSSAGKHVALLIDRNNTKLFFPITLG